MSISANALSLLQIRCFVHVVEAGSFVEAGRRLGMTTSGVSKIISRFEAEHGVRLLHRSTHAVSLTDDGEALIGEARGVLRASERFEGILSETADHGRSGRVRISAAAGFTRVCLLPMLPRLLAAHPEIQIEVRASYGMADLAEEGVDLALRTGELSGLNGHLSQLLFAFRWCAYATPGYLARRGTPLAPEDLAGHDLIGFRNTGNGRVGTWRFRDPAGGAAPARHDPDPAIIFDDGSAAYEMARDGFGIVYAPEWLARDDLRSGRVVEILAAWRAGSTPLSIVCRNRQLTPHRIATVIAFLREAAPSWAAD